MNLHLNQQEQIKALDKLLSDHPTRLKIAIARDILIIRVDDRDAASHYAARINQAGWAAILIKNSFCDRYIIQVYLHRS